MKSQDALWDRRAINYNFVPQSVPMVYLVKSSQQHGGEGQRWREKAACLGNGLSRNSNPGFPNSKASVLPAVPLERLFCCFFFFFKAL